MTEFEGMAPLVMIQEGATVLCSYSCIVMKTVSFLSGAHCVPLSVHQWGCVPMYVDRLM